MAACWCPARARLATLLLAWCFTARRVAAQAQVPVLGNLYALEPVFPAAQGHIGGFGSSVDGAFSAANFHHFSGTLVWDSRNISVAYVLDTDRIRVVNFAAQTVATLSLPASVTTGTVLCGNKLIPQTLFVTFSSYTGGGFIRAFRLSQTGTAAASVTSYVDFNVAGSPNSCTTNAAGTKLFYTDTAGSFKGVLSLDLTSVAPTPTHVSGVVNSIAPACTFDGPALGAGAVCYGFPTGLALDATERYLYVADAGGCILRLVDLVSNNVTTVAGTYGNDDLFPDYTERPVSAGGLGISHYAPAPALQSEFTIGGPTSLSWSRDGSVLFVADGGRSALPIRALTFNGPRNLTMWDFGIYNRACPWFCTFAYCLIIVANNNETIQ